MKTVALDLHDFSVLRSRMDLLLKLKEHFPGFKVSLFTIPFDYEFELTTLKLQRPALLTQIQANLSWMEIIPHGITHTFGEFETADKQTMRMYLDSIEGELGKDGFTKVEHGFCAPNWLWSQAVVDVLNEKGWWGAVDRNQPQMLTPKRFYRYSHSLEEPFWLSTSDTLKLHGHMTAPSLNNLEDCFLNLFRLPPDTSFVFASELVETHEDRTLA